LLSSSPPYHLAWCDGGTPFLFSFNFNSYVCYYVGSVCTVSLLYSCDVLEPVTEEQ
jgi:hypothetical protein